MEEFLEAIEKAKRLGDFKKADELKMVLQVAFGKSKRTRCTKLQSNPAPGQGA